MPVPGVAIAAFCQKWGIAELALFGSVLRQEFGPESDLDVLVTFAPGVSPGLLDRVRMVEELQNLFHRPVDLVERRAVEESPNYLRRQHILESAEVVYAA